jgi:hypothetical protein
MRKIQFLIFITLISIWACTQIEISPNKTEKAVLQGYLYANQPITEIQITKLIPKESDSTLSLPITDAEVFIICDEKKYNLSPTANRLGYYHYGGKDLEVVVGKKYAIEFEYFGRKTSAETTIPALPKILKISPTTIYVSKVNGFMDLFNNSSVEEIKLTWDNASQDYYYTVIDNLEASPQKIVADGALPNIGNRNFNFISSPTRLDNFTIRFLQLEQFGKHRIKLFRVNKEYADLYNSQQQDSRSLNEPITNVKNGLGVFTAFNMDSVFFEVKRK